ncbi:MAG: PEP-CTERM sorting domain-containing protein [Aquabacterium sp.]
MIPIACRILALSAAALLAPTAGANVVHHFDSGAQGWRVTDIAAPTGVGAVAPWDGGGQRLVTRDVTSWTVFDAPDAMLHDLSAYAGGRFSFDLQDTLKDANADSVATFGILGGNGARLFWYGGSPSTTLLSRFEATLGVADSRWRLGGLPVDMNSGVAPTAQQWAAVLADVAAIRINADWKTGGNDQSWLDNVALTVAVPEPQTYALLAIGLAAVGVAALRRRAG